MSDIGHQHPLHGSNHLYRCHRYSFAKMFLRLCRQCRQWGSAHCLDHTEHLKTQRCLIRMQWSKWCIWIQTWLQDYTRGGEVELSAEHSCISGVPSIITHCPPASINTYLHSPLKVIATTTDKPHHPTETHNCRDGFHQWMATSMPNTSRPSNLPTVTDQKLLLVMAVEFNPQYVLSTATP